MSETNGHIFNIQHYSLHDGAGIRTTVFFAGCNLRCAWCHNPESFTQAQKLQYFRNLCAICGRCGGVCDNAVHTFGDVMHTVARERCVSCGKCVKVCPNGAVLLSGRKVAADEVVAEILSDKVFYDISGGGATLSGGEPLLQPEFAAELMRVCKDSGIHTAVESAFLVPWHVIEAVIPHTDLFLVDLKVADDALHKKYTGVSNQLILENIARLDKVARDSHVSYAVRFPYIPELHDDDAVFATLAQFLQSLEHISYVEPLRFHRMAEGKYESLELQYPAAQCGFSEPDSDMLHAFANRLRDAGVRVFTEL